MLDTKTPTAPLFDLAQTRSLERSEPVKMPPRMPLKVISTRFPTGFAETFMGRIDTPRWKWARFAVWDIAGDGAFTNPIWSDLFPSE